MVASISAIANGIAGRIPLSIRDHMLPGRRKLIADAGTTQVAPASRRLLIGPVNSAGQAFAWAHAAERLPGVSAANFMYRDASDTFRFPADHAVPTSLFVQSRRWQRAQRRSVEQGFTHVIVESGRHLFGTQGTVLAQIEGLRRRGVSVALLWHGSDIRTPSVHASRERDSPFHGGAYPDQRLLEEITRANHELIRDTGLPVFVSTPDLLAFVPGATWLPVVVDVPRWAAAPQASALTRARPVVVHAPSRSTLKGSGLIAETVRRLRDEGVIEYREITGVPAERMPDVYGDADVVLDQFSLGIYGVAACEALAAGRLVVSHVGDDVRAEVLDRTGIELPIVQARATELESTLREIAAHPERFVEPAAAGPAFAEAVHDGRRSADVLRTFIDAWE